MRCINYKCNSCGGKVTYNEKHSNWKCEYCNLEYSTLYKNDKSKIEQSSKIINVYEYKCPSCKSIFVKNNDIEFKCQKCGEILKKSKKINCNFFFKPTAQVENYFLEYGFRNNKIDHKYESNIIKYIRFAMCKGEVIIRYKKDNALIKRTYIYSNFPTAIDTSISNEIKKKLSYLNYARIKDTNNEQLSDTIEITNEISYEKIDVSEIILNECVKNLIEETNIKENSIINIENNLSVIDNIFIPFYPGEIIIDNSSHLNYQIAISNPQQILETVTENYTIIDDKPRNKRYRFVVGRCFLMFFLLGVILIIEAYVLKKYIKQIFIISIISFLIFIVSYIIGEIYFIKKGGIIIKKDKLETKKSIMSNNDRVKIEEEILK